MKNKKSIFNIIICSLIVIILACTGCSAAKSDEERWNDTKNVIDAESVKDEADYSKFDNETEVDVNDDKSDTDSITSDKSAKDSVNSKSDSSHTESRQKKETESKENEQKDAVEKEPVKQTCTISISCSTILSNMDKLKEGKESIVPGNGVILGNVNVEYEKGDTVFDILKKVTRNNGIHMEYTDTPAYNSAYIEGIANLYENDCGNGSGWMYSVNGWYPDYGCSQYDVQPGDVIKWSYTCDLGRDL